MKIYRGTDGDTEPVEIEWNEGDKIEGFYFSSEREAWQSILKCAESGVILSGCTVKRAEKDLLIAQKRAADRAKEFAVAQWNYGKWKAQEKKTRPDLADWKLYRGK